MLTADLSEDPGVAWFDEKDNLASLGHPKAAADYHGTQVSVIGPSRPTNWPLQPRHPCIAMLPTLPESSEPIEIVDELDEFNPIETLLEDAVDPAHGCDAPARFIDFIDTLLASKPPDDVWLIEALRTTARRRAACSPGACR